MEEHRVIKIVERCQQGDREAFGQLYTMMEERLRQVCRRYVSDEDVVNDLLHDAFVLIFSKIDTLKDPSSAEAWMQKVVQNLSLVYLQKHKQQSAVPLDELNQTLAVAAPTVAPITYEEIMNLVDMLPKSYQRVFRLSVLEGLSHQEIAALLNIDPHTSSANLVRAKKLLRNSLTVLLLSLLAICLPLGVWYGIQQSSQQSSEKAVPVRTVRTIHPRLSDNPSAPLGQSVRTVRTIRPHRSDSSLQVDNTDILAPLTAENKVAEDRETEQTVVEDTIVIQEEQQRQTPSQRVTPSVTPLNPVKSATDNDEWTVALAYNGINSQSSFNLPYGEKGMNDPVLDTITHHRMPVTIGLQVNKMLNKRFSVGSGLQYTQLYSETHLGNTYAWEEQQQKLRYMGVPLQMSWYPLKTRRWNIYGTAQTMLELPLKATQQKVSFVEGYQVDAKKLHLHPSCQWSVGVGVGLEYRLTPVIGIYAESSMQYFFKTGDGLDTWRTEHPATFSVPVGIRITIE